MSLWISSVLSLGLLLLQTIQFQTQHPNDESKSVSKEEVTIPSEERLSPIAIANKDRDLKQAYLDVFKILSSENTCSRFYGGPLSATTALNGLAPLVKAQPLVRGVSFQMTGRPHLIRDPHTGAAYRLFDRVRVNTNGSFYQRRSDVMRRFPSDIGDFAAGSRPARALILLHELGHLMQGEDGEWLLPDDGYNSFQSNANTLLVQQACRRQLDALK
jgi:hypothetical protein